MLCEWSQRAPASYQQQLGLEVRAPAEITDLRHILGVAADPNTRLLYIASIINNFIRAVTLGTGITTTIAGVFGSGGGYSGDGGQAVSALMSQPVRVAVDLRTGDLYTADMGNSVIRMVASSTGVITTIAGVAAQGPGYTGDGGRATSATQNSPIGLMLRSSSLC